MQLCGIFRLPSNFLFLFSIACGAYTWLLENLRKSTLATMHSVFRIFFILSFAFLGGNLLAYIDTGYPLRTLPKFFYKKRNIIIYTLISHVTLFIGVQDSLKYARAGAELYTIYKVRIFKSL